MSKKVLIIVIVLLLTCTGCLRQEVNIIDDLAIIIAMGFETFPDEDPDKVSFTTVTPLFGERAADETRVMTVSGFGLAGAMDNWQRYRNRNMAVGKVQLIVFGENITENGLIEKTQDLRQIPEIEVQSSVIYFPGDPKDILALKPPEEQRIGTFVNENLMWMRDEGFSLNVSLHDLWSHTLSLGRDPFMPMFEIEENEEIPYFSGMALLDEEAKLATTLDFDESKLLYFLMDRQATPTMTTKLNGEHLGEGLVIFSITSSDRKVEVDVVDGNVSIDIIKEVKMRVEEVQMRDVEVVEDESFEIFAEDIAKDLTLACTALVEKLQEANTDPLGLGHFVRIQQTDYYHQGTWRDDYPEAEIGIDINIDVIRGTTFQRNY
ncbi:Ger(x)C family spore germination protein [Proteinivorax hydrogeniformans]|uniref:Ger(X)C family spore germination protein n=1 Tax=Proteinivorax hydrogeniformans TaxID=1826727 RepID=A0AAU8HUW0_9FIRM